MLQEKNKQTQTETNYKKGDEQSEQVHLGSYYTMDNGNVQPPSIRSKARMCFRNEHKS